MTDTRPDDHFADFPEQIRDAIAKSDWQAKLRGIASKYHLRIDQGSILENETLAILDGSQSIEEYTVHLATLLKLNEADLRAMAADLEREIFSPIQKALQDSVHLDEVPVGSPSLAIDEDDDLDALLNEGDAALEKAAAMRPVAPAPVVSPVARNILGAVGGAATPATNATAVPVTPKPAPAATPAVSVPLSTAVQKLAAPVVKPTETVVGNLQKPATTTPITPAPLTPPSGHDPYREPVL